MSHLNMKKHIDDLRNVLYIHDLTVALEEDIPAFPATWTLTHPYFTLPFNFPHLSAHAHGFYAH